MSKEYTVGARRRVAVLLRPVKPSGVCGGWRDAHRYPPEFCNRFE